MFDDKRSHELLENILHELREIHKLLEPRPTKIEIRFIKGDEMSAAAVALNVGQKVSAVPVETNADGSNFQFSPANIQWSVQDGTVASVAPTNTTDGSTVVTALKAGTTQVGVADTVTGLSATATVTVNPAAGPTSMSIKFGTPA